MKILYLVDYYQPQIGYNEFYLPRQWSKLGHEVKIMTSNYYYPFPSYDDSAGKLLGPRKHKSGSYYEGKIEVIKMPMRFEIFTRAIFGGHRDLIQQFRPDLVIVNKSSSYNSLIIALLKKTFGYTFITYDAHLMSGYKAVGNVFFKNFIYFLYRQTISKIMNSRVDKYIAVQEGTVEVMTNLYGQSPVEHIPLGTDPDRFYFSSKDRIKIRRRFGIKPRDMAAIYTGKVIPTKGLDILFKAFNLVCQKYPSSHLIIVGDGAPEYINQCMGYVSPIFQHNIHFAGFKDNKDLYKYYSAGDFGVWPLEESTSMNDAASCGIPFIANDQAGVKYRFKNNNALRYKRADHVDLSKQMIKCINNPSETKKMGQRGRELIVRELSWNKIAQKYLDIVPQKVELSLIGILDWLCRAQDATKDGGVSAYYSLIFGWAPSFIETTGYIISTFLTASKYLNDPSYLKRSKLMGDFLLRMQLQSGGYRTYTPDKVKNSDPTIFNTAQDIIGLVDLYHQVKQKKYLNSAIAAVNFLVKEQQPDGSWSTFTHDNIPKTYHARVAWAILKVYMITKDQKYKKAAIKSLDWVMSKRQSNGFFELANLPSPGYPYAITHTIAYVAEGLYQSGKILNNKIYLKAAQSLVDKICSIVAYNLDLSAYYDKNWDAKEKFGCPTGEAQFADLCLSYYSDTQDKKYLDTAYRLLKNVISNQGKSNNSGVNGGIAGCTPIYGDISRNRGYCRLCYINWAAKFSADAQMNFLKLWQ